MQIPNEGEQKINQEINFPNELNSVFADSVVSVSKGDMVTMMFLESLPLDRKKKKVVAQVNMTPNDLKGFVSKMNELIEKAEGK